MFGTFSSLGARMWTRGLVCPLFLGQTIWFGTPNFCNGKGELVGHGFEDHDVHDSNDVRCAIGWWKPRCGVLSHLYQRVCASCEVLVGWDRVAY